MESKLLLNNKGPRPIEIVPILYGADGLILQIPTITVERNSFTTVDLRDWADTGGEVFRKGNIRLYHRGKDLVIGAQITVVDENHSLVFENKLTELGKFDSTRFEAVWWVPNNDTESTVALTNTSDEILTVTAILTRKPNILGEPKSVYLQPHQTKVLNVRQDFDQGNAFANSKVLGLTLFHSSPSKDALIAWTLVKDESKGYSNVANFYNPAKAKSNRLDGAGL